MQVDKQTHNFFLKIAQASFYPIDSLYNQIITTLETLNYAEKAYVLKQYQKEARLLKSLPDIGKQYVEMIEALPPVIYDLALTEKKALNDQIYYLSKPSQA